jgi:branched-chain amino acid transport system permease protein
VSAFLHQLLSGLALGAIYAIVALAVVMVYKATRHVNFAVGEMAMFAAFVAAAMIAGGFPYWVAFAMTLALAFTMGFVLERVLVDRLDRASPLSVVVVMIGLLLIFNSMAGWLFGFTVRAFPSPFASWPLPTTRYLSAHETGVIVTSFGVLGAVYLLFEHTRLGLALRATADNRISSRLVGIRVDWMLAFGWGLAAAIAAVAAMMVAPLVYLEPNTMAPVLIYGLAAAVFGGIDSAPGAVAGGLIVGAIENLAGAYVVGPELKLAVALALIVSVLIIRPAGLFGTRTVSRV